MFSEELVEQIESEFANANKIITDIFERRERKIILKALANIRTGSELAASDNLLLGEAKFYKRMESQLRTNRNTFLKGLLTPVKREEEEQKVLKTIKVRILEDIPSFVWDDEKAYGPFEKGSEQEIPEEIAEFLVDNNKAVKNETAEKSEEVLPALPDARGAQSGKSQD
jgi:DNA replication initiation complex subunit (GINS family)